MKRTYLIILMLTSICLSSFSQSNVAQEAYFAYKVGRNVKGNEKSIASTIMLLKMSDQLTLKQVTNASYHLGRMYEEVGKPDSAIIYYEKSLKGEPNYSVIHRALGFIYLTKTKPIIASMNEASKAKDVAGNTKAFAKYKEMVIKALPYLEKYQACEPDEETLATITNLYKSIKDLQSLASLETRLKPLAANCVSLLEDE